ncbi:MAG: NAD-dependent epimerase/dehydratase family protein [Bacteroidota bacterium]|nr:NAD-dependent epimerase/dehydratase family protein [Bacteroidota bacterium]
MKIFVSGATGYIGSHLVKALSLSGHEVHAFCRSSEKAKNILWDGVKIFTGALDNVAAIKDAMDGCEQVYHLAAFAKVWARDSGQFYRINVEGTKNILNVARDSNVKRVVFTSTGGIYGASFEDIVTEDYIRQKDFFNEYEGSKCLAESWVKDYVIIGLDVVIVSPTRVYGPYLFGQPESVTGMIYSYVSGKWRWLPGPADKSGNYVYIRDVVNGHLNAMEKGISGRTYILGGSNHSNMEFFNVLKEVSGISRRLFALPIWLIRLVAYISLKMAEWFGIEPQLTPKWVAKARYDWRVSAERSFRELKISPTSLSEGLKETVNWIRS